MAKIILIVKFTTRINFCLVLLLNIANKETIATKELKKIEKITGFTEKVLTKKE